MAALLLQAGSDAHCSWCGSEALQCLKCGELIPSGDLSWPYGIQRSENGESGESGERDGCNEEYEDLAIHGPRFDTGISKATPNISDTKLEAYTVSGAELQKLAMTFCARVRILTEKVRANNNPKETNDLKIMLMSMQNDLEVPEEKASEHIIGAERYDSRTSRAQLYTAFWSAVENYELGGTEDLVGPILTLEHLELLPGVVQR